MPLIILVLLSAFLIEGIGTWVSVVGLSALFSSNPVIILLAVALDIGKIATSTFLYKFWSKINVLMRAYMTLACLTLMLITSTGAFGFLSRQFQSAIQGTNQDAVLVTALTDEQARLQKRKQEIDSQVANLPSNSVNARRKLMASFAPEQTSLDARLQEIDKQLPALKVASISRNTEVGPIIYVAQAFNTDPEHAVKWVILIIIFVFDPLAISLLLAGNFLIEERGRRPVPAPPPKPVVKPLDPFHHLGEESPPVNQSPPPAPEPVTIDPLHKVSSATRPRTEFQRYVDDEFPLQLERYGSERYVEPKAEQLDHVTSEQLGRQKPHDPDVREVHSLDQIVKPIRSQLEDIR